LRVPGGVTWIQGDRLLDQLERLGVTLLRPAMPLLHREQDDLAGPETFGGPAPGGVDRCLEDDTVVPDHLASDPLGQLALRGGEVVERAIEALRPELRAGRCVDQLRDCAKLPAVALQRAVEHVADAEVLTDPARVPRSPGRREARAWCDDGQDTRG
jgi:hypothetical protein